MSLSCLEFRQLVGAEPGTRDPAVLEHRLQCRACAAFADEQAAFDRRLEAALRIPVPDDLKARVIWNQGGSRWQRLQVWRWAVIAAGLAVATGLGVIAGQVAGERSLPAEVIAHIEHEPGLLNLPAGVPVAEPVRVSAVLDSGGVRLSEPLDNVVSAGLCPFRGRMVPHLVMYVDGKPVSILLLRDEHIDAPQDIREDGFQGVVVPSEGGSIAIVGPRADLVVPVRRQLERAVHWKI